MSAKMMVMALRNGISSRVNRSTWMSPMAAPPQRQEPQGGVASPIAEANTMVTMNATTGMSSFSASGMKIGVKMRMIGIASRNVPMARYVTSIPAMMSILFVVTEVINSAMASGTCAMARIHPKITEAPTAILTVEVRVQTLTELL